MADLELLVGQLRSEVVQCKLEVARLRHVIDGIGGPGLLDEIEAEEGHSSAGDLQGPSSRGSYSLVGGQPHLGTGSTGAATSGTAPTAAARPVQNWSEREAICADIGRWVTRCLAELPRGSSGRDRILLSSRVWLVIRDYERVVRDRALIFHRFSDCKPLVKREQCLGDSIFVGLPSLRELRVVARVAVVALQD